MRAMRLAIASAAVALAALSAGCKEGGTINVHSLSFKGVQAVDEGRLKDALATHQSSKIPWGKKSFFDRSGDEVFLGTQSVQLSRALGVIANPYIGVGNASDFRCTLSRA